MVDEAECTVFVRKGQAIAANGLLAAILYDSFSTTQFNSMMLTLVAQARLAMLQKKYCFDFPLEQILSMVFTRTVQFIRITKNPANLSNPL
ncbi:MAG TPA: hypothetical protein VFV38_19965 [Ktedonobacteraceae bacterium]|nr:hypothetical protein [Ktedonobacteraceae bacterium]